MTTRVRSSLRAGAVGVAFALVSATFVAGATPSAAVSGVTVVPATVSVPTIKVSTYNIHKSSSGPSWSGRKQAVADTILGQAPDVLALEEATPHRIDGVRQYEDILDLIDNDIPYKFAAADSYTSGTKLAYNSARLTLVDDGTKILKKYGSQRRYAIWAVFQDKNGGQKYFVVATHLEPGSSTSKRNRVRITQAKQVLALVRDKNTADYPVVIAGDMNSSRSTKPYNGQYLAYTRGGMIDPLDNPKPSIAAGENAIAQTMVDVNYNSANKFRRVAPKAPSTWRIGTNVDYIYVSDDVEVTRFQTVVDVDEATGEFNGIIPSDHNMLTATVRG